MLDVQGIEKQYERQPLLCGLSFAVGQDETVCLLGPSGGGKSTILRIIAGLESAEAGRVLWDGQDITREPAHLREFGLMFQDYALFPHLNVFENIAFGLRSKRLPSADVEMKVDRVLEMVGLGGFEQRSVIELSGGEKQRVAFARAVAPDPKLLMLDEPMGSLDRALREQLLKDLRDLLNKTDIPVVYVTHDQEEAFSIADRILILHNGRIVQSGPPASVYSRPQDLWIAAFFGFTNRLTGRVVSTAPLKISTSLGELQSACGENALKIGEQVDLVLTSAQIAEDTDERGNLLRADVVESLFMGNAYQIKVRMENDAVFTFRMKDCLKQDEAVLLNCDPSAVICFKEKG